MPTRKKEAPEEAPKEYIINNELPILYVDDVNYSHRTDGINHLSFTTNLPDQVVEQVRIMIQDEHLNTILSYLCESTGHFPRKPRKIKRPPSK